MAPGTDVHIFRKVVGKHILITLLVAHSCPTTPLISNIWSETYHTRIWRFADFTNGIESSVQAHWVDS